MSSIIIIYRPIGIIHSSFENVKGVPIQPPAAKGVRGVVEIFPEYVDGLKDLDGFSHIFLIYHFHMVDKCRLVIKPFLDYKEHGVFATRAPSRPNPIGISVVRLLRIEGNLLYVSDLDIVDGTPLLDIKPYVPHFDVRDAEKIGWLSNNVHKLKTIADDGRFIR